MPKETQFDAFLKAAGSANPGARIHAQTDGSHIAAVGLGDKNFCPLRVYFDHSGQATLVEYPQSNVGYAGVMPIKPVEPVLNAATKLAAHLKGGVATGDAMAALANAAGAQTPGTSPWGTRYNPSAAAIDTSTNDGAINAGRAIAMRWAEYHA